LYNTLIEIDMPTKLDRLIRMCIKETYRKVRIGKNLSYAFPVHKGLKRGGALSPLLFNFALEYAIRNVKQKKV